MTLPRFVDIKNNKFLSLGVLCASAREQDHCTALNLDPDYAALHPGYRAVTLRLQTIALPLRPPRLCESIRFFSTPNLAPGYAALHPGYRALLI
jgi:hypothetical protein